MTEGEAKVLETDVVIFPMRFGAAAAMEKKIEEPEIQNSVENLPEEKESENRFARLKKSLRKRSVSIL